MSINEINVGNIGQVYLGPCDIAAEEKFNSYVEDSRNNYGRAAGEDVVWFQDGEIHREYSGTLSQGTLQPTRSQAIEAWNAEESRTGIFLNLDAKTLAKLQSSTIESLPSLVSRFFRRRAGLTTKQRSV